MTKTVRGLHPRGCMFEARREFKRLNENWGEKREGVMSKSNADALPLGAPPPPVCGAIQVREGGLSTKRPLRHCQGPLQCRTIPHFSEQIWMTKNIAINEWSQLKVFTFSLHQTNQLWKCNMWCGGLIYDLVVPKWPLYYLCNHPFGVWVVQGAQRAVEQECALFSCQTVFTLSNCPA